MIAYDSGAGKYNYVTIALDDVWIAFGAWLDINGRIREFILLQPTKQRKVHCFLVIELMRTYLYTIHTFA